LKSAMKYKRTILCTQKLAMQKIDLISNKEFQYAEPYQAGYIHDAKFNLGEQREIRTEVHS
jgi:hypothetical protein